MAPEGVWAALVGTTEGEASSEHVQGVLTHGMDMCNTSHKNKNYGRLVTVFFIEVLQSAKLA